MGSNRLHLAVQGIPEGDGLGVLESNIPSRIGGFALMEALVGMLIFSLGILGMIGMQASAMTAVVDTRERMEAVYFVNQLIGQMWADDRANLLRYGHHPSSSPSGAGSCAFSGAASTYPNVTTWLSALRNPRHGLPGSPSDSSTQIVVTPNAPASGTTTVSVTVCWKTKPQDAHWHNHTVVANIGDS
jgi:type IV pilus assembly protein PilV